jgi:hypothetical protein
MTKVCNICKKVKKLKVRFNVLNIFHDILVLARSGKLRKMKLLRLHLKDNIRFQLKSVLLQPDFLVKPDFVIIVIIFPAGGIRKLVS